MLSATSPDADDAIKEKTIFDANPILELANERVSKGEHHGHTNADQEGSIDKTGEQEHLRLKRVHQFGLTSSRFEVLLTHDADAKAGADSTEGDDEATGQGNHSNVGHCKLLKFPKWNERKKKKEKRKRKSEKVSTSVRHVLDPDKPESASS